MVIEDAYSRKAVDIITCTLALAARARHKNEQNERLHIANGGFVRNAEQHGTHRRGQRKTDARLHWKVERRRI